MSSISIKNLSKYYGANQVLKNICLDIGAGEFVAVIGPSGCGKTTLLRTIAGFEALDAGQIMLGNKLLSSVAHNEPPEKRNLSIVFQSYALWPHMSVAENVSYSLKVKKLPRLEQESRTNQVLEQVELTAFAQRYPAELSGGQRQRVALARCLVAQSPLILLDEPLANLDVNLRAAMEEDFIRFHQQSGATLIYITHDQKEAMALADRIVVMHQGEIMQFDTPYKLYAEPQNAMVATFIDDGRICGITNIEPLGGGCASALLGSAKIKLRCAVSQGRQAQATACFHVADLALATADEPDAIAAVIKRVIYRGHYNQVDLLAQTAANELLTLQLHPSISLTEGEIVHIGVKDGWILPSATVIN